MSEMRVDVVSGFVAVCWHVFLSVARYDSLLSLAMF